MGKYDLLEAHLRRQSARSYDMSFRDIERILGNLLPKSAHSADWWGNESGPSTEHVQCRAWLRAGFRATPRTSIEHVRFTRVADGPDSDTEDAPIDSVPFRQA
jgi:hypothetical protein